MLDVVQVIKQSMPQEAPDSLGMPAYVDIVSYLLKSNGSPAGASELPVENDALRQILMSSHAPRTLSQLTGALTHARRTKESRAR